MKMFSPQPPLRRGFCREQDLKDMEEYMSKKRTFVSALDIFPADRPLQGFHCSGYVQIRENGEIVKQLDFTLEKIEHSASTFHIKAAHFIFENNNC